MKKIGLISVFVLIFLTFLVQADTTFFDNPDDFFIMGEISEDGAVIQQSGGGSSGGRMLSGVPDDEKQIKDTEEPPEKDMPVGNIFIRRITFLALFFLATLFVLYTQKIIFKLLRT